MFDVFSVKRMYNITVNTGKNNLIFTKNDDADDDDDDDKLGYSFLKLFVWFNQILCVFYHNMQTDSSHNASIRPD